MKEKMGTLCAAIAILFTWLLIVMGGEVLQAGKGSLTALITEQIVISLFVAPVFLFALITYFKWDKKKLGLQSSKNWRLLWFPALFAFVFFGLAMALGLPPLQMVFFALINSILVGVSEELMFRGIIFRSAMANDRISIWPAIWITSLLFGGIHALNGFMTGNFFAALIQALAATMSGFWLHAIALRTRSLYPAMFIHGLWDFSLFVLTAAMVVAGQGKTTVEEPSLIQTILVPLALPLPLFLYGLYLLRGIGKKNKEDILQGEHKYMQY